MPIDATIPLGFQSPNGMKTISDMIGMKSALQQQQIQQQTIQSGAMANEQSQIDLQETKASRSVLANWKNYVDADGNLDFNRLGPDIMSVAPKNGAHILGNVLQAQQQATVAKQSWMQAQQTQREALGSIAGSLIDQDPEVVVKSFDAAAAAPAYANMTPALKSFQTQLHAAAASGNKTATNGVLKRIQEMAAPVQTQQPAVSMVPTESGTQPYNTNGLAPGGVGPMGAPMAPPPQVIQTTSGGAAIANPVRGTVHPFSTPQGVSVDFPAGESKDTQAELQAQRTTSQQIANQAPTMHNLNRGIVDVVDRGIATGKWGEVKQKIASTFGYQLSGDGATDYNILGKLLERSALTAAQGMGPHTNAGLEAQVRANGSTDYSPQAIRKIATLNDALTTGATLYENGLEQTITNSQDGVFAKRKFDQQWANAMNPSNGVDGVQALRFKNAVDSGDKKELGEIIKEVGGQNSKGAQALYQKLQALHALAGQ